MLGHVFTAFALVLIPKLAAAGAPSLFIEDLTWPEVRAALQAGRDTTLIYAGSTEQNGPHLALGKHNFIARHVAERIAVELGNALVYPIVPFAPTGDPDRRTEHMRFPGSVSVTERTFAALVRELASQGIASDGHAGVADTSELMAIDRDGRWLRREALVASSPEKDVTGDPRRATAEMGRVLLDIKVQSAVAQIRALVAPKP